MILDVLLLQQRHSMAANPNRVRAASIGAGEAARVAAMHAAITQGMTPKQAYSSMSESFHPSAARGHDCALEPTLP